MARGEFTPGSDIDLILVCPTGRPFHERILDFEELLTGENEMDILIYTPSEFEALKARAADGGFWKSVLSTMVRIV